MNPLRSLAARLAALLVCGVLLGELIATGVVHREGVAARAELLARFYTQRIEEVVGALEQRDSAARARLAQRLEGPQIRLVEHTGDALLGDADALRFERLLRQRLRETLAARFGAAADAAVLLVDAPAPPMRFGDLGGPPTDGAQRPPGPGGPPPFADEGPDGRGPRDGPHAGPAQMSAHALDVRLTLADGTRIGMRFGIALMPPEIGANAIQWWAPWRALPDPVINGLLVLTLVMVTTAVVAAFWVVRPLRRMAGAAEALGRDLRRAPLPERGPDEVVRASRAFNDMQQRVLRLIDGRTEALAAMSHDLRTPITRIRLRAELLPDEERERLAADLEEVDGLIGQTLDYMRGIDDAEAEAVIDCVDLVGRCVDDLRAIGADVRVGRLEPLSLDGRPTLLRRALTNLLDNACKYARDIEASAFADGADVVLRVADRGSGVPDNMIDQLVRPFFRVESSRNRATGGTGLGLAIVKGIVERHGGRLLLANRPGGGFVAEMRLPRSGR